MAISTVRIWRFRPRGWRLAGSASARFYPALLGRRGWVALERGRRIAAQQARPGDGLAPELAAHGVDRFGRPLAAQPTALGEPDLLGRGEMEGSHPKQAHLQPSAGNGPQLWASQLERAAVEILGQVGRLAQRALARDRHEVRVAQLQRGAAGADARLPEPP